MNGTMKKSLLYPNSNRLQVALPDSLGQMDNASPNNLQQLMKVIDTFLQSNTKILENVLAVLNH